MYNYGKENFEVVDQFWKTVQISNKSHWSRKKDILKMIVSLLHWIIWKLTALSVVLRESHNIRRKLTVWYYDLNWDEVKDGQQIKTMQINIKTRQENHGLLADERDNVPEILLVKWQSADLVAWVSSWDQTVNQVREWFAEHLEAVNRRIHLAGQDDEHKGMGTTLEALAFCRRNKWFMPMLEIRGFYLSGRITAVDQWSFFL